jgi:hypothetical protein
VNLSETIDRCKLAKPGAGHTDIDYIQLAGWLQELKSRRWALVSEIFSSKYPSLEDDETARDKIITRYVERNALTII